MKKFSLRSAITFVLQTALLLFLVSTALDWVRKPNAEATLANSEALAAQLRHPQMSQFAGQEASVLYFWATWCGVCRHTSPTIEQLRSDGVPVLAVALQSGDEANVANYLREHGLGFANVNDESGELARQWGVQVTPTIIILKNGEIVHHTTGLSSYYGLRARLWWANLWA
ncbi:MAG: protein disulfide oxidoreductase [Neisseria sp.]|nr:protein disulfide oxidoreductase [Neisseria sp.]